MLVELADADEDADALLTDLADMGPTLVADVHLVQWGYGPPAADGDKLPPGLCALRKANIPFYLHNTLDLERIHTKALVRIPAATALTAGALTALVDRMRAPPSWISGSKPDHYALSNGVICPPRSAWSHMALAYGWLLVLLVCDAARYAWHAGTYHRRGLDVTARLASVTFPNRVVLAPHRWWCPWNPLGSGIDRPIEVGDACLQVPHGQDMPYVMRLLRTHPHMGLGLWLLPFTLYYCAFAAPWWHLLLPRAWIPFWWMNWPLDPRLWPWYWQMVQATHALAVALVSYRQLELPFAGMQSLHVLLYPLWLATFPLVLLWARLVRHHSSTSAGRSRAK